MYEINFTHTAAGATLFAAVRKLLPAGGFGDAWDETNQEFGSPALADLKIPLTEGTAPYTYLYSKSTGPLESYTGLVLETIHDDADSDKVLATTQRQVLAGNTLGTITKSSRDVEPPFKFRLSRRADGTIQAVNKIAITANEAPMIGFDFANIASADWIAVIGDPTIDISGELTATVIGISRLIALVQLGGAPQAGDQYRIQLPVVLDNGDALEGIGFVQCKALPT